MKLSILFKKSLVSACYVFCVLVILSSLLLICFYDGMGVNPVSVSLVYPFLFAVSFANNIVKHTNLKSGIKLVSHFSLVTLSLILFIYLPHSPNLLGGTKLIVFVLYVILYIIGASLYLALTSRKKRKTDKKSEYKKVF